MVQKLTTYHPQDLSDLNALMHDLSAKSCCSEALLKAALSDANVHVFVIRVDAAKSLNVHHIQLTSNPARIAANRLYQSLGFERYETNCYKMMLLGDCRSSRQ